MTLSGLRAPFVVLGMSVLLLGLAAPWLTHALVQRGLALDLQDTTIRDRNGQVLASVFTASHDGDPAYVWGPLYDPDCAASPDRPPCRQRLQMRVHALGPGAPQDLIRFTDSRLTPVISVASANFQVARIAQVRHMPENEIRTLIADASENPMHRLDGTPSLNLLKVNLLLDGRPSRGQL